MDDFRATFDKVFPPDLAERYFNELKDVCKIMCQQPVCLIYLIMLRISGSMSLVFINHIVMLIIKLNLGPDLGDLFAPGAQNFRLIQYLGLMNRLIMIEEQRHGVTELSKRVDNMLEFLVEHDILKIHMDDLNEKCVCVPYNALVSLPKNIRTNNKHKK